jgi:hypothetical protein
MNNQSGTPELFKRISQNGIFPFMEKKKLLNVGLFIIVLNFVSRTNYFRLYSLAFVERLLLSEMYLISEGCLQKTWR